MHVASSCTSSQKLTNKLRTGFSTIFCMFSSASSHPKELSPFPDILLQPHDLPVSPLLIHTGWYYNWFPISGMFPFQTQSSKCLYSKFPFLYPTFLSKVFKSSLLNSVPTSQLSNCLFFQIRFLSKHHHKSRWLSATHFYLLSAVTLIFSAGFGMVFTIFFEHCSKWI